MNASEESPHMQGMSDEVFDRHEQAFFDAVSAASKEGEILAIIQAEIALNMRALVGYVAEIRDEVRGLRETFNAQEETK